MQAHMLTGTVLCLSLTALTGCAQSTQQVYEESIRQASVRGPGWDAPLWPLAEGSLSVSTFTEDAVLDTHSLYVWVAPTREVWRRCRGKHDPVLALQQILGLPPQEHPRSGHQWHLFVFDIRSQDLFRPCPGGIDRNAPPEAPRCRLDSELDPALDAEFTQFLLQQWWSSHRATVEHGHDPELGYPWTGIRRRKPIEACQSLSSRRARMPATFETLAPTSFCGPNSP